MALFGKKTKPDSPRSEAFGLPLWTKAPAHEASSLPNAFHSSARLDSVDIIASTVAVSDPEIYHRADYELDEQSAEPVSSHPFLRVYRKPCLAYPEIDGYALMYITVSLVELVGECFWVKVRGGSVIKELLPFPASWCIATPTESAPCFSFNPLMSSAGRVMTLPPGDVVWFKSPNLLDPFGRGRGRTESMGDEIDADELAAKWQKNLFYNEASPPVVISIHGATQVELDRARESWTSKVAGWLNARKPAFTGGQGVTVTKLSDTAREMEYIESRNYLRDSFIHHYSIPPEMFGIIENSNRATIDAAYYLFSKNTIKRRLGFYNRVITSQIIEPDYDASLMSVFKFDVPADEEFRLRVVSAGWEKGTITRAEWRSAMRYPVDEARDNIFIEKPKSVTLEKPEEKPEKMSGVVIVKAARFPDAWEQFDRKAAEGEGMFRSRVRAFAHEQKKRVMKAIASASPSEAIGAIDMAFGEEADQALLRALDPAWTASMHDGVEYGRSLLSRKGVSFDLFNNLFLEWIKINGLKKANGINETTHEDLRAKMQATLAEGIENGETIEQLSARLVDAADGVYENMSTYRAEMIARTETVCTVNYGSLILYIGEGIEKKEWLASPGGSAAGVRDAHQVGAGYGEPYIVAVSKAFMIGGEALQYPGDPAGSAGNVIECRCSIVPVVEG